VLCGPIVSTSGWIAGALAPAFDVRLEPITMTASHYIQDEESSLILLDAASRDVDQVTSLIQSLQPEATYRVVLAAWSTPIGALRVIVRAGIGDFVDLPCSSEELLLRLEAVAQRNAAVHNVATERGIISGDRGARLSAASTLLTTRERVLFGALAQDFGKPVIRRELRRRVWGETGTIACQSNVVDVYICYLRKKLEMGGTGLTVRTTRGGYALVEGP
jgi:DNA-binding response OmpR family regulator